MTLPRALGIEVRRALGGPYMNVIIPSDSILPASGYADCSCREGVIKLSIVEGDGGSREYQNIGNLDLKVLGVNMFKVYFYVSENGVLTAKTFNNGVEGSTAIQLNI